MPELGLQLAASVGDDHLSGLRAVTEPETRRAMLQRGLREGGWLPPDAELVDSVPTVVTR